MEDRVYGAFLERQYHEGMALARASDFLSLIPVLGHPPMAYIAEYTSKGYLRGSEGEVLEGNHFEVGIRLPPSYLRRVDPVETLTWIGPLNVFHANILPPMICIGQIAPGTPLVDLLYQLFEVIGGLKVTPREEDALNFAACQFARSHPERFPIERRPLKRPSVHAGSRPASGGA